MSAPLTGTPPSEFQTGQPECPVNSEDVAQAGEKGKRA